MPAKKTARSRKSPSPPAIPAWLERAERESKDLAPRLRDDLAPRLKQWCGVLRNAREGIGPMNEAEAQVVTREMYRRWHCEHDPKALAAWIYKQLALNALASARPFGGDSLLKARVREARGHARALRRFLGDAPSLPALSGDPVEDLEALREWAEDHGRKRKPLGNGKTSAKEDRRTATEWRRWRDKKWKEGDFTASFEEFATETGRKEWDVRAAVDRDRKREQAAKRAKQAQT